MRSIFVSLILIFSFKLTAGERKLTAAEEKKVHAILAELIDSTHSSLRKPRLKIKLHTIDNPAYFFESNFGVGRALLGMKRYKIGVNPLVFDKNIPDDALKGVLAHELIHTEDYASGNTFNTLIPIGIAVLKSKTKIQYERKTDLKVILKGLEKELIAYKNWQYPLLNPNDLRTKKKEYLTPEEIRLIVELRDTHPEVLKEWLNYKIPLDIDGVELALISKKRLFANHLFDMKLTKEFSQKKRGQKFILELKSLKQKFIGCTLKAIPYSKKGHNFDEARIFKLNEIDTKKSVRAWMSFKGKMKGVDFILKSCEGQNSLFIKGFPNL
ncbi:MAG: hypothetical protein EP319_08800 [Deltaproteobacteria bacterium]|nr:MAG: hypothetical protein EP319_08800 [Deltaproteobacteria bacterium]